MATKFSNAIIPNCNTDAGIRQWAQWIEDLFVTTGGWVVTSDTGQTLPSALVHPVAQLTKAGYRIYRMSDSLQATSPVFVRIDYGSGQGAPPCPPSFWVTIGTGTNGAGVITGVALNSQQVGMIVAAYNTGAIGNCFGSAFHNRCALAMFVGANTIYPQIFSIERTRDATGADTGNGLLLAYTSSAGGAILFQYSRYVNMIGTQPSEEAALSFVLSYKNPSELFAPGDIGLGILIHFNGVSQQPGVNWLFCNSNDVAPNGVVGVQLYGTRRTYQTLGGDVQPYRAIVGSGFIDTTVRAMMRYD